MADIQTELLESLRRQLRAQDQRLRMLAYHDTPNSRRLRDEASQRRADLTKRLNDLTTTTAEPSSTQNIAQSDRRVARDTEHDPTPTAIAHLFAS